MSDRITTTCSHTHTVTLRLDEGEWDGATLARITRGDYFWDGIVFRAYGDPAAMFQTWFPLDLPAPDETPPAIRAELEAALAAAEAACGGCGCADRLRAEARDLAAVAQECIEAGNERVAKIADAKSVGHFCAADFLDAAPDARGSES